METKYLIVPFERKAAEESGEFEGYGSTFGNIDHGNDIVVKGAFLDSLAEWNAKNELPMLPWMHDIRAPIGDWLEMREDEKGLYVKGKLWVEGDRRIESAVQARNLLTGTGPKGLSIGYRPTKVSFEERDGTQIRLLEKVDLMEISVVGFGMNPEALVSSAKSMILVDDEGDIMDIRSFEKSLRDGGLSVKQAKTLLSGGYSALTRDENGEGKADDCGNSRDADCGANDLEALKNFLSFIKEKTNV